MLGKAVLTHFFLVEVVGQMLQDWKGKRKRERREKTKDQNLQEGF